MPQTQTDYERQFWKIAFRSLPHHGLLFWAIRQNNKRLTQSLDARFRRRLGDPQLDDFPTTEVQNYLETTRHTAFWHGAGRLQYKDKAVIDVFLNIIEAGRLTPSRDVYSVILTGKEMRSISATTLRIIARSYADTHGLGDKEPQRYGSSLWWVAYYYNLCHVEVIVKHGRAFAKNWPAFNAASRDSTGQRSWGKKVHKDAKSTWDVFGLGSDIAGNYPIIFGIKSLPIYEDIPGKMSKWEVRITQPVALNDITHLEVPASKVAEISELLVKKGHQIPVFPIELAESLAAQQSVAKLLYNF